MNARAEWLAQRRTGIGGSDAAAALGLDPYRTAFELYLDKRGELVDDDEDSEAAIVGRGLEGYVAQRYSERTGNKVERFNGLIRRPDMPWQIANVDRLVWEGDRRPHVRGEIRTRHGLECKTALGKYINPELWGPEGTDQVPDPYFLQCMHYMAVTGAEVWDLAALLTGPELRIYTIRRDEDLIGDITARESELWQRIQRGDPPPMDYEHASTSGLLRRMYPGTDGSEIDGDAALVHWLAVRDEAKALAKQYEAAADAATARLLAAMGPAAVMHLPGHDCTRKLVQRSAYAVEPTEYIDFRIKTRKDAK